MSARAVDGLAAPPDAPARSWPVVAVLAVLFVGIGATLPALPAAVRETGAGGTALGVVLGVFAFASIAGRFVAGRSTDRRGRVVTMRAGLLVALAAGVLFALPLPVAGLAAARALHGLADALAYTAASAWLLDRTPEERRPHALALMGAGIWGGFATGPLIGALLDLRAVGLLIAGTCLAALLLTVGLPDAHVAGERVRGLRALLPRGVTVPGTALGLGNLGYAAIVGFLVVHLDDRGGEGAVALAAFSVAVLVGRLVVVPLAARVGILRTLPYGLLAMAAGLLVIAATERTAVAAVAAAVVGLGYCLPFPALGTLVAGRVAPAQRGAAIGALTAFYDVFVGVGSVAAGVVADRSGTPAVFTLAAVGVVAAAAVNVALGRSERTRPHP